ncbi:hypothetical protein EON65_36455 [archaeon]|nr:MAG: hypothetical protein EON65_36455 [archaeon]
MVSAFMRAQRAMQGSGFAEEQQQLAPPQPALPQSTFSSAPSPSPIPTPRSNPSASLGVVRASLREGGRPSVTPLVPVSNINTPSLPPNSRGSRSFTAAVDPPSPVIASPPTYSSRPMHLQRVVSISMSAAVRAEVLGSGLAYSSDADVPVETSAFLPEDLVFVVAPPPRHPPA